MKMPSPRAWSGQSSSRNMDRPTANTPSDRRLCVPQVESGVAQTGLQFPRIRPQPIVELRLVLEDIERLKQHFDNDERQRLREDLSPDVVSKVFRHGIGH